MKVDLHVHSQWSPDGQERIRDLIIEAIRRNVSYLAITDHLDLHDPLGMEGVIKLEEYLADIQFTARWFTELRVLKGIEAGVNRWNLVETENLLSKHAFDLVLLSVHNLQRTSLARPPVSADPNVLLELYLSEVLYCVEHMEQYQVLAHLDYPLRYLPLTETELRKHENLLDRILKVVIDKRKALEVNTAPLALLGRFHPPTWVLQRYRELGGELISIGSDAHRREGIAQGYEHTATTLRQLGFETVTVFVETRPKSVPL
ncbi:histidinol-phosphatase HisJ family protein [Coprothermobacteraceae bacterium]|nr:histidinol-phosphatase HisJ family protein [Coprothermobacteraceae bacterium]